MPDGGGSRATWFEAGLRFRCHPDCGRCCVNHGDAVYVYLEGDDAARLADFLGLDLATFLDRHAALEDGLVTLRADGEACRFLDGTRCSVHEARPVQCRTFPFWREHLASRAAWERLRDLCPGIDDGDPVPGERVAALRDRRRLG